MNYIGAVDVTIIHVEQKIIEATLNLLYSSSVHSNYYTDVFILKNDINRAD